MKIIDSRLRFTEKLGNFGLERNLELSLMEDIQEVCEWSENVG